MSVIHSRFLKTVAMYNSIIWNTMAGLFRYSQEPWKPADFDTYVEL